MNIKTIITIVIALMVSLIIMFLVPKEETLTPKNVYRVYLAGKSVGLISDKDALDEYIDKEQQTLKDKYNADKVYAPEDLEVVKDVTYNEDIIEQIENANKTEKDLEAEQAADDDGTDPLLMEAIDTVVDTRQASTCFIQRRFKVGYARAGRIIDQMEERGVISGYQGSKPREVLMSKERWEELKMSTDSQQE